MSKLKPLGNGIIPRFAAALFSFVIFLRNRYYDVVPWAVKKTGFYTISIGGIQAGGTGKTPLSLLVGSFFSQKNESPVFLSRGYGRKSRKPVIVAPYEQRSWEEIGDEPTLLHNELPHSWLGIGADRVSNALTLQKKVSKPATVILDDGFQHRKIFRHKNILCLSKNILNDSMQPAGYLREPISALKRAHIVCLIGTQSQKDELEQIKCHLSTKYPTPKYHILYQSADQWVNGNTRVPIEKLPLKNPLLLSGIANPDRFTKMVEQARITPYKTVCYEDHHVFTFEEISALLTPKIDGIITTEKDFLRLSSLNLENCPGIWYLKIKLTFPDRKAQNIFYNSL